MRLGLERRLQDETPEDQTELPEELQEFEDRGKVQPEQNGQDKSCPFGFTLEEDDLPLSMPPTPSFQYIPERLVVEDNSCSSDTTESSCSSSDCDAGGCLSENQNCPVVDGGLTCALSLSDSENNNYSLCSQLRHIGEPVRQHSDSSAPHSTITDTMGPCPTNAFKDNKNRTDYLDENANQARGFFDDNSLGGFPNTPSPTVDYSLGRYMDLSLSSDSDLEFFDSDYPSVPLHSSFKGHRHPDSFRHLQLFNSVHLPQYESSTHLLESLIGLTEPSTDQIYPVTDSQLL